MRNLLQKRLRGTVDQYCNEFVLHYMDANSAAESLLFSINVSMGSRWPYEAIPGLTTYLFLLSTEETKQFETWRQTKVEDTNNKYISLDVYDGNTEISRYGSEGPNFWNQQDFFLWGGYQRAC